MVYWFYGFFCYVYVVDFVDDKLFCYLIAFVFDSSFVLSDGAWWSFFFLARNKDNGWFKIRGEQRESARQMFFLHWFFFEEDKMEYIIKGDKKQAVSSAQGVPRSTTKVYISIQIGNIK
jgi:hypothetical protein